MMLRCGTCGKEFPEGHGVGDECSSCSNQTFVWPNQSQSITYDGIAGGTGDDRQTFASGAMSSGRKPRYDLIPTKALARIARRFELGALKYGENNWQKGVHDKAYILDRINHAIEHLMVIKDFISSDVDMGWDAPNAPDDDAAAVIVNAIFVMEYQRAASRK